MPRRARGGLFAIGLGMLLVGPLFIVGYKFGLKFHRTKTMLGVGIALMILGLIFLIIDCWKICLYLFCIACLCKDPIELEEMDQRQNQNNETEDAPRQQWWVHDTPIGGNNGAGNRTTPGAPPSYNAGETGSTSPRGPTQNETTELDRLLADLTTPSERINISPTTPPGLQETRSPTCPNQPPTTCPSTVHPGTPPPPAYHDVIERGFVDIS